MQPIGRQMQLRIPWQREAVSLDRSFRLNRRLAEIFLVHRGLPGLHLPTLLFFRILGVLGVHTDKGNDHNHCDNNPGHEDKFAGAFGGRRWMRVWHSTSQSSWGEIRITPTTSSSTYGGR